ncbi:hypothetical protein U0028_24675 [Pseudomonas putida]|uniref:hypothetical protein n=1 Tax=Pseudomonas putida TaxID=303 RepID=UPI0013B3FC8F|nr:hypothetical protein [Pseudomonas putida]ELU0815818.1 hypothetical protein [Pseudomonas putida]WQE53026.1 hypothetical protein U0028_24675 [Pseudomonas putida]HDS1006283.1 hypothetical protein [Pseudomonas putida]
MGRKRVKRDISEVVAAAEVVHPLNLKSDDGLYPFSPTWHWEPKAGKARGKVVSLTIDVRFATTKERLENGKNSHRHFYSEFESEYLWAVEVLGRGLKSYCLENRCSHNEASYKRNAIGYFLGFCRKINAKLRSSEDLDYNLICQWRADLRLLDMESRYKSTMFRRVCVVLEKLMGTDALPNKFTMPIYTSDAPEHLPLYSDAVMYQLIGACVSDISKVMDQAKKAALVGNKLTGSAEFGIDSRDESAVCGLGAFSSGRGDAISRDFKVVQVENTLYVASCRGVKASGEFCVSSPDVRRVKVRRSSSRIGWLTEAEIPTIDTIYVFLLFFLIFSGKNKEVVESWKRLYRIGDFEVSPLDWKDPLDPTRCRLRGWKGRKGPSKIEADDTFFSVSGEIFPVLEFLIWYTEPLQYLAEGESTDALWLYAGKKGVADLYYDDNFYLAASKFLSRHSIWDFEPNENGEFVKVRLSTLDSRRFRKVHAAREFLKTISTSHNYQELQESLKHALSHKDFDTTLGNYLSKGISRTVIDIGIFTLQNEYVDEARKFRGLRVQQGLPEGMSGFYSTCIDPRNPDFEGALQRIDLDCREYDMCFGCSKSRVFDIHLPRVAARIMQYESMKAAMSEQQWQIHYGKKHARASDLLQGWSDKKVVEAAWESARRGDVKLPFIVSRG